MLQDRQHKRRIRDMDDMADRGIKAAPSLSQQLRTVYKKTVENAIRHLPRPALEQMHRNATEMKFYKDSAAVSAEYQRLSNTTEGASHFFDHDTGMLYLGSGRRIGSRVYPLEGMYVHEFGHCIDRGRTITGTQEWQEAWRDEMANAQLTPYSAEDEQEGLAEFIRELYTGRLPPSELMRRFPRCAAILEDRDLWKIT